MSRRLTVWLLFLSSLSAVALPHYGSRNAFQGGEFKVGYGAYPPHLLYYLALDDYAYGINNLVLEPLLEISQATGELIARLAKHWEISPDKSTFTFLLDPKARFSDGTRVTARDVKFTWDTLLNPKNRSSVPYQNYLRSIGTCEVTDASTVRFRAKTVEFKNLEKIASLFILPAHIYSKGDFNSAFSQTLVGSGPYRLDNVVIGERIALVRSPDYWGKDLVQNIGRYNFEKITIKVVPDQTVQFERLKRGDIDYFYFNVSKMWVEDTRGPLFEKNYIKKLKVENNAPFGTMGIYWNLRRPLFQDVKTRHALSSLMNREKFIKELFFSSYALTTGQVGVHSPYHSPLLKPVPYDPSLARQLFAEAGWGKVGKDGVRVNASGQRFEFELLNNDAKALRHLSVYQQDLSQMGIKMNIRTVDWTTALRLVDDREFDAVEVARSRDLEPNDFERSWGSAFADQKQSANITGYKNPEVDRLARAIDRTFEKKERVGLVRKLDEAIAKDHPVSYGWEPTYSRLGFWNKFSFVDPGYLPYSDWRDTFQYWWLDPQKETRLKKAMETQQPLT